MKSVYSVFVFWGPRGDGPGCSSLNPALDMEEGNFHVRWKLFWSISLTASPAFGSCHRILLLHLFTVTGNVEIKLRPCHAKETWENGGVVHHPEPRS